MPTDGHRGSAPAPSPMTALDLKIRHTLDRAGALLEATPDPVGNALRVHAVAEVLAPAFIDAGGDPERANAWCPNPLYSRALVARALAAPNSGGTAPFRVADCLPFVLEFEVNDAQRAGRMLHREDADTAWAERARAITVELPRLQSAAAYIEQIEGLADLGGPLASSFDAAFRTSRKIGIVDTIRVIEELDAIVARHHRARAALVREARIMLRTSDVSVPMVIDRIEAAVSVPSVSVLDLAATLDLTDKQVRRAIRGIHMRSALDFTPAQIYSANLRPAVVHGDEAHIAVIGDPLQSLLRLIDRTLGRSPHASKHYQPHRGRWLEHQIGRIMDQAAPGSRTIPRINWHRPDGSGELDALTVGGSLAVRWEAKSTLIRQRTNARLDAPPSFVRSTMGVALLQHEALRTALGDDRFFLRTDDTSGPFVREGLAKDCTVDVILTLEEDRFHRVSVLEGLRRDHRIVHVPVVMPLGTLQMAAAVLGPRLPGFLVDLKVQAQLGAWSDRSHLATLARWAEHGGPITQRVAVPPLGSRHRFDRIDPAIEAYVASLDTPDVPLVRNDRIWPGHLALARWNATFLALTRTRVANGADAALVCSQLGLDFQAQLDDALERAVGAPQEITTIVVPEYATIALAASPRALPNIAHNTAERVLAAAAQEAGTPSALLLDIDPRGWRRPKIRRAHLTHELPLNELLGLTPWSASAAFARRQRIAQQPRSPHGRLEREHARARAVTDRVGRSR